MSQVEQSDIKYCPDCACMIEEWWNYCAICGFHTASHHQQRNETAAHSVGKQPLSSAGGGGQEFRSERTGNSISACWASLSQAWAMAINNMSSAMPKHSAA